MNLSERLGKFIVHGMREEPMRVYTSIKERADQNNIPESVHESIRGTMLRESALIHSLSDDQLKALDQLVLKLLDTAAFSLLREIQESMDECVGKEKIQLLIQNEKVTDLDLDSGTLFGEYQVWAENYSDYGPVNF